MQAQDFLAQLEQQIGYTFVDPSLRKQAFIHSSYQNENRSAVAEHNERLEFLGDAVLGLVIADLLLKKFPQDSEGALSKKRASLVNEAALAQMATKLGVADCLRLGRGELSSGGKNKPRLLCSTFEALLGGIYLDGGPSGFANARRVIEKLFAGDIATLTQVVDYGEDYKTRLQEQVQVKHKILPHYVLLEEAGLDHQKIFSAQVVVGEQILAQGSGRSKKSAEQEAARLALVAIANKSEGISDEGAGG